MNPRTVHNIQLLERSVVAVALIALIYRATAYAIIGKPEGAPYGVADIIDFALGLLVFALGCLCAGAGVMMTVKHKEIGPETAYRPAVVGMTTFVAYYLIHPYIPALGAP